MLSRTLLGNSGTLTRALCNHFRRAVPTANTLDSQDRAESCRCSFVAPRHCPSSNTRGFATESSGSETDSSEGGVSEAAQPSAQRQDSGVEDEAAKAEKIEAPQEVLRPPGPNPNADMDDVPLPDASRAEQMIADLLAKDPQPPLVVNQAGPHSPGWKIMGIDEERYVIWWVLDLTGGRIPWADRNAKLSDRAKYYMYRLNKFGGWSVRNIARLFNVRQERVMAIVALQQIEAEAREQGQPLLDDLQDTMDALQGATEMRGTGERHIRLLPTKPIFEVLDKQKPGKREESKQYRYPVTSSQSPDDAGWESEVYAREEELGAHEGRILAREFKQRLAYNIGQAGQSISKASRRLNPPKRPAEGWSLVVRPNARGKDYEPFVAKPDSTRRALTDDEVLYLRRMKPLARRKIY